MILKSLSEFHIKESFVFFSLNSPIILPLCDIANLFECMAMFYLVKELFTTVEKQYIG